MTSPARRESAERHAMLIRDVATAAARTLARPELFALPMGAPTDGCETAMADLTLIERNRELVATCHRLIDEKQRADHATAAADEQIESLTRQLANADAIIDELRREKGNLMRGAASDVRLLQRQHEAHGSTPATYRHVALAEPVSLDDCGELGRRVKRLSRAYRASLAFDTADTPDCQPTSVIVSVLVPVEG